MMKNVLIIYSSDVSRYITNAHITLHNILIDSFKIIFYTRYKFKIKYLLFYDIYNIHL